MIRKRRQTDRARSLLALLLLASLIACGTQEPVARPVVAEGLGAETVARLNPQVPVAPPTAVPGPLGEVTSLSGALRIAPMQAGLVNERVALRVLVIAAESTVGEEPNVEPHPALAAWTTLLDQMAIPYDTFVATEEDDLTYDRLVEADGTGRYQAVLLATSNLGTSDSQSAFSGEEWSHLFQYERDFDVRQVAFETYPQGEPEGYGIELAEGVTPAGAPEGYVVHLTQAGSEVFRELAPGAAVPIVPNAWLYPSQLTEGSEAEPLLVDDDGNVLAVRSVSEDGRERIAVMIAQAAWGGRPILHTQLLGPSLIRWATQGVHLGERRLHLGADVDDWFIPTGIWNMETDDYDETKQFILEASDAASFAQQQAGLRTRFPAAAELTWTMAFNGEGAQPGHARDCDPQSASLSAMTKCLVDDFWWVNHTWSHAYMDRNPPHTDIEYDDILAEITRNDDVAAAFGMDSTPAREGLVTGDISGLGWHAPSGPESGEDKEDHGLGASNPDLLRAVHDTGRTYLASNMSVASHEPDCAACGIRHPLNTTVLLVPRWPTNVFAPVYDDESATDAYNALYGPGGPWETYDRDLSYDEYMDVETDIALEHVLSGSPYQHYFHVANLHEYEPGRSLLNDWATRLLEKYTGLVDLPLRTLPWDDLGAYVADRTSFANAGATGVWNRSDDTIEITAADGGIVFLTGASFGVGTDTTYGGDLISWREFGAGERFVVGQVVTDPPEEPRTYALTMTTVGSGRVDADPAGPYGYLDTATVTATPGDGWRFAGWGGDLQEDANPAVVAMDRDKSVTATFVPDGTRALTVATRGDGFGVIVSSPGGIACTGTCVPAPFAEGAEVTLVPVALYGSTFQGWSGACSDTGGCTVRLDGDATVHARFGFGD